MYRIRSASGTEATYNSLEEFTAAVRRGNVAPEDEIFHSRANRWLDVKSHPHYRSAINWSGPLSADAIFSPIPAPPPTPPKPAAHPAPPSGHNGAQIRHVAENPAVTKPAATTVRPQLAAGGPGEPAVAPPPASTPPVPPPQPRRVAKTRDLTFLDLEEPQPAPTAPPARQNATIIQARKPPTPPSPAKPPTKQPGFLVMDTGLEHPSRGSNGHRTVAGDADMLFDTPAEATLPPSQAAVAIPPTAVSPKAQVSAPSAPPATPQTPPKPPEPPKADSPGVAAVENLDIPGPPLLELPIVAVAPAVKPTASPVTRSSLGLVIGAVVVLMLAAVVLSFWRPWSGKTRGASDAATAYPAAAGAEVQGLPPFGGGTETTTAAGALATPVPVGSLPAAIGDTTAGGDEEVIAARPSLRTAVPEPTADLDLSTDLSPSPASTAAAPSELARRLEAAERQAQQELAASLGGFKGVLATTRLASSDGAAQAQGAWSHGADAIRQYRAKIARLEQAYEDSALASQRTQRWTGEAMRGWATRQSLAEPGETSQMADLMLNQVNEGLGLLVSLDGQYEIRDGRIKFKNPASASRYVSIRTWVEQRTESWASTPEGARPHTVTLILRALGEGFPPME